MKLKLFTFGLAIVMLLTVSQGFGQYQRGKVGIGFNAGVQRVYGDRTLVNLAPGGEAYLSLGILPFADLSISAGYSQLKVKYSQNGGASTTDMFNLDLKSNLNLLGNSNFSPYITIGTGIISHKVRNAKPAMSNKITPSFFGGGGFKLALGPKLDWHIGADYRYTTSDQLDNPVAEGQSKDGYLTARTGLTYFFEGYDVESPQVIASERAPFYEVDDPYEYSDDQMSNPSMETQDMEEYVKLKSKVDALNDNISSKDGEINRLRNELSQRKNLVASMENQASGMPKKNIRTSGGLSGFTEMYKEALTHYYNKNYSEAISLFELIMQQYPQHSLASSCQYWIAQSKYEMNNLQESIDEFYKVLSFDKSLKKDDALFQIGIVYNKLGMNDRARQTFNRLLSEYPNSEYSRDAQNQLNRL